MSPEVKEVVALVLGKITDTKKRRLKDGWGMLTFGTSVFIQYEKTDRKQVWSLLGS